MSIFIVPYTKLPYHQVNFSPYAWASNTSLTINPMQIGDSTVTLDLLLPSVTTLVATGNGLNGLDTGSLAASTWYYLYIIGDSTGKQVVGTILSASATGPMLPFGYDSYALIGMALTNSGTHFNKFYITGNGGGHTYWWDTIINVLSAGAATSFTAIDLTPAVPPINFTEVTFHAGMVPNTAGDTFSVRPTGSSATSVATFAAAVAAKSHDFQLRVVSQLSSGRSKIDYLVSAGTDALTLDVLGFNYNI